MLPVSTSEQGGASLRKESKKYSCSEQGQRRILDAVQYSAIDCHLQCGCANAVSRCRLRTTDLAKCSVLNRTHDLFCMMAVLGVVMIGSDWLLFIMVSCINMHNCFYRYTVHETSVSNVEAKLLPRPLLVIEPEDEASTRTIDRTQTEFYTKVRSAVGSSADEPYARLFQAGDSLHA